MERTSRHCRQPDAHLMQHRCVCVCVCACVCVCVCVCASPVAGDTVDHAHADWHCSTAEITNHYYAAEDEEHLRPSPTHRRLHTLSIPPHKEVIGAHFRTFISCVLASLLSQEQFYSKRKDYISQNKSPQPNSKPLKCGKGLSLMNN